MRYTADMGWSEVVTGVGAFVLGAGVDRYLPYFVKTKSERDKLNEKRVDQSRDRKIQDLTNLRDAVAGKFDFWTKWNQNPSRPKNKHLDELAAYQALFTAASTSVLTFAKPAEAQEILWFASTFASWFGTVADVSSYPGWDELFSDDPDDFLEAHAVVVATIRRMLDEA